MSFKLDNAILKSLVSTWSIECHFCVDFIMDSTATLSATMPLPDTFASGRYSKRKRTQVIYAMEEMDVSDNESDFERPSPKVRKQDVMPPFIAKVCTEAQYSSGCNIVKAAAKT